MVNVLPKTLDPKSTLKQVQINKSSVESQVKAIISNNPVSDSKQFNYWLLKAITVIDLTTLAGDDTRSNVLRLCSTAVRNGATEIDVVLDRSLVLMGKWSEVFKEVELMKEACGLAHMKVILGVGELGTYENVYYASMASMMAGADFIKTSTGKEAVNATLPVGLVMCRAIR
ncbi:Deoxyribose-phosphate aldolase, partial [Operophtera brumata]